MTLSSQLPKGCSRVCHPKARGGSLEQPIFVRGAPSHNSSDIQTWEPIYICAHTQAHSLSWILLLSVSHGALLHLPVRSWMYWLFFSSDLSPHAAACSLYVSQLTLSMPLTSGGFGRFSAPKGKLGSQLTAIPPWPSAWPGRVKKRGCCYGALCIPAVNKHKQYGK